MSTNFHKGGEGVDVAIGSAFAQTAYVVPRVNLLPPEIEAERRFKRTQLVLGGTTLGVVAVLGAGLALSVLAANDAEETLLAEQARTQQLVAEEGEYAEVPLVLGQVESAQAARSTAMAGDVLWYQYLNQVAATYPKDLWLRDLTVTVNPATPAGAAPVDPVTTPGIGTVVFNGTGLEHPVTAEWLDVLGAVPGFADPAYTASTRTEVDGRVVVDNTVSVVVTGDALSHRYDRKAS
jgi:hypothetical protein